MVKNTWHFFFRIPRAFSSDLCLRMGVVGAEECKKLVGDLTTVTSVVKIPQPLPTIEQKKKHSGYLILWRKLGRRMESGRMPA